MGLVRHDHRPFGHRRAAFRRRAPASSIYSRAVNTCAPLDRVLKEAFPWCAEWEAELKRAVRRLRRGQAAAAGARLRRPAALLGRHGRPSRRWRRRSAARFDHVLVDEYQDTNLLQASILRALKPDGRGLTVVGDDAQSIYAFRGATVRNILDFPRQFSPAGAHRHAGAQLPLDPADPRRLERGDRRAPPSATPRRSGPTSASAGRPAAGAGARRGRSRPASSPTSVLARREGGLALKSQAVLFRTSHHSARAGARAGAAQHPVRQVRRPQVPRGRARQGPAGGAALRPEPARPHGRLPGRAD